MSSLAAQVPKIGYRVVECTMSAEAVPKVSKLRLSRMLAIVVPGLVHKIVAPGVRVLLVRWTVVPFLPFVGAGGMVSKLMHVSRRSVFLVQGSGRAVSVVPAHFRRANLASPLSMG